MRIKLTAKLKSLASFSLLAAYPPPVRLTCLKAGGCGTNQNIPSTKNKIIAVKKRTLQEGRIKDETEKNSFNDWNVGCAYRHIIYDDRVSQ
ncbi:exported hypothetical protein [Treponema phagedenis]|uniref:Lipoprotein n=1 Tax=Treponema phagedenis TaxID=162 RepID=A0A0B7H0D6_TREPH|nr:exported hypothetical protein [Treponema phagedenis]